MGTYIYRSGNSEHHLTISTYEAHLSVLLNCFPPWRVGVFASHKIGNIERLPINYLLSDAKLFLGTLEAAADRLQYRYSLKVMRPNGETIKRGCSNLSCSFRSESVVANAGPGFCALTSSTIMVLNALMLKRLRAAGEIRDYEVDRLSRVKCSAALTKVIHDLRDMNALILDDGRKIQAERRSKKTDLPERIRNLIGFLSQLNAEVIDIEFVSLNN